MDFDHHKTGAKFWDIPLRIYWEWNIEITTNIFVNVNFIFCLKTLLFYSSTLCFSVLWTSTFYFFIIERSVGPVILTFGVNIGSSWKFTLSGPKIHNVCRRLIQLWFNLPPGKVRRRVVEWTARWHPHSFLLDFQFISVLSYRRCRVTS